VDLIHLIDLIVHYAQPNVGLIHLADLIKIHYAQLYRALLGFIHLVDLVIYNTMHSLMWVFIHLI
jgi:hypothetical protein